MRYKVGDRVKLKLNPSYTNLTKKIINNIQGRIVMISAIIDNNVYYFKNEGIRCNDNGVECLIEKYIPPVPIKTRWEILDL